MKRLVSSLMAFALLLLFTTGVVASGYNVNVNDSGNMTLTSEDPTIHPATSIMVVVTKGNVDWNNETQWLAEDGSGVEFIGSTTHEDGANITFKNPGIYNTYIKVGTAAATSKKVIYINSAASTSALSALLAAISQTATDVENVIEANRSGLGLFAEDVVDLSTYDFASASTIILNSLQGKTSLNPVETLEAIRKSVLAVELNNNNVSDLDIYKDWFLKSTDKITKHYNSAYKNQVTALISGKGFINASELDQFVKESIVLVNVNNATEAGQIRTMLSDMATELGFDSTKLTIDCCSSVAAHDAFANFAALKAYVNAFVVTPPPVDDPPSGGGGGGGGGGMNAYTHPLTGTESVTNPEPVAPIEVFSDISSVAWAKDAILDLYNKGVINGREEGRFYPNDSVSREEFVKMLMAAFDLELVDDSELPFSDVDQNEWYYNYIKSAYIAGVTKGITENSFGIGQNISRQDLCTMIVNAITVLEGTIEGDANVTFGDEASIEDYAKEAVKTLTSAGVLSGDENKNFNPAMRATRAEAAKIIYYTIKAVKFQ